jgi:pathogenesis-related protein 1
MCAIANISPATEPPPEEVAPSAETAYVRGNRDGSCPAGSNRATEEICRQLGGSALEDGTEITRFGRTDCARHFTAGAGCFISTNRQVYNTAADCPSAAGAGNHDAVCVQAGPAPAEAPEVSATPVADEPQLPPPASNQDAGQGNNVWVHLHNEKRALHGSCPVVWNEAVAAGMQEWVDGLTSLEHADSYNLDPPQGPAGENLAWSSGQISPEQTVNMWYNEVSDCITLPGCEHGRNGAATGHFTAMVWKGVRSVGCAISSSGQFSGCRYRSGDHLSSDSANMGGSYVNNVAPSGSAASGCQ